MFESYAQLLLLNEKNRETWLTAPIAGHTLSPLIYSISVADGYFLAQQGYTYVAQLFGEDYFTGGIQYNADANIRVGLGPNAELLINKCKMLRQKLAQANLARGPKPTCSFERATKYKKWSGLFRQLNRIETDSTMPGPPSYFTRRRDGIPVPSLQLFMQGYNNLFKMGLSSKTLEVNFHILNRCIWTNQKQNFTTRARAEEISDPGCQLCGQTETTLHLIFECSALSEPLWALLAEKISIHLKTETGRVQNIILHNYNIMYNMELKGMTADGGGQTQMLIQEIKRMLINKRYTRCTSNMGRTIVYDRRRIASNLSITIKKLIALRDFQSKNKDMLESLLNLLSIDIDN